MILNPWPIRWEMGPPSCDDGRDRLFHPCPYVKDDILLCARSDGHGHKREGVICRECFFYQQGASTNTARKIGVQRICDRCGAEIGQPDRMLYNVIKNRKGERLADMELCLLCSQELIDWVNGNDFPTNQITDNTDEEEEEYEHE